jgi:hypothetical protein
MDNLWTLAFEQFGDLREALQRFAGKLAARGQDVAQKRQTLLALFGAWR